MAGESIAVVVISRDEGAQLRWTVENLDDTLPAGSRIVVVDDGSRDGSAERVKPCRGRIAVRRVSGYGVARARNLGASMTSSDIVVYADAHIRLEARWWQPLCELLEDPAVGAAAPAITDLKPEGKAGYGLIFKSPKLDVRWLRRKPAAPKEAPILPGCCFATRRDVIEATGGWDEAQKQRGNIDNEGCVRFWLLGYRLMVTPETVVRHQFRKASPYPVGWPEYLFNRLRLAFVHFGPQRLGKVVAGLRKYPGYGQALAFLADSGIAERRREILSARVHDDDWFFEKFGLEW